MLVVSPLSAVSLLLTALLTYRLCRLTTLTPAWRVMLAIGQAVAVWAVFKSEWPLRRGWVATAVPLGLSYYTFRQIHYAIEQYKRTLPAHTLADYLTYFFFCLRC